MVGSDHFHQFWVDNYPQFLVGKAPRYDATFHNEIREFGLPKYTLIGDEAASGYMLQRLMDKGFDMAVSFDLKIDHSIICPIITTRPQADLPVVPIYANIFVPPMPSPKRFYDLGRAIREVDRRISLGHARRSDRNRSSLVGARRPQAIQGDRPGPCLRSAGDRMARYWRHRCDPRQCHAREPGGGPATRRRASWS